MSNDISLVMATGTAAARIVSEEPTGFIGAVDFQPDIEGATFDSTVSLAVVSKTTGRAWSPGMTDTLADSADTNVPFKLDQAWEEVFHLTGEQIKGLNAGNFNASTYIRDKFAEAQRAIRNRIDGYIAGIAKIGATRALGTAGTTPFASNLDATATLKRILNENGAPDAGLSLVLSGLAAENARKLMGSVTAAGGSTAAGAQGQGRLPVHNSLQLRESVNIATHTSGTGSGYTLTGAAKATAIAAAAGSGTILAGDVLTITGLADPVVVASALAAGSLGINRPGLRAAISGAAASVAAAYTPNVALHRRAIVATVRPPAQADLPGLVRPFYSDVIVDPVTGLPYGVYMRAFDGGVHISLRVLYKAAAVNTEHIALLLG